MNPRCAWRLVSLTLLALMPDLGPVQAQALKQKQDEKKEGATKAATTVQIAVVLNWPFEVSSQDVEREVFGNWQWLQQLQVQDKPLGQVEVVNQSKQVMHRSQSYELLIMFEQPLLVNDRQIRVELIRALADELTKRATAFLQSSPERLQRLKAIQEEIATLSAQRSKLEAEKETLEKQLVSDTYGLKQLHEDILALRRRIEDEEVTLAGLGARRNVLSGIMSDEARARADELKKDPENSILKELETLVSLRASILEKTKRIAASGTASQSDVDKALEALTLAKIEYAKELRSITQPYNEEILRIKRDLDDTLVKIQEGSARRMTLDSQLTERLKRYELHRRFDKVSGELMSTHSRLHSLQTTAKDYDVEQSKAKVTVGFREYKLR